MRRTRRLLMGFTALIVVCAISIVILAVLEISRLPSVDSLAVYLPTRQAEVPSQQCIDAPIFAVPMEDALHFRDALKTAEGEHISTQIARTLMCGQRRNNLRRGLDEVLLSVRIDIRFTPDERNTIYLNRVYLSEGQFGIGSAARHYFHCTTDEASLAQQALLMAMPSSPSRYSPTKHPAQAALRRNAVLASMVRLGSISTAQQEAAQAAPLLEQSGISR